MYIARVLRYSFFGIVFLCMLVLAACGGQPTSGGGATPTATQQSAASTPTANQQSTPTPTTASATLTPVVAGTVTASALGTNIIMNGDAEQGECADATSTVITSIPGWTPKGNISPIQYGASSGNLGANDPGPTDRGKCYFWGGPDLGTVENTTTSMTQTIDISAIAQQSANKALTYQLSAWLGGYSSQDDNAAILVQFMDASNNMLGSAKLGPILAKDRNSTTELASYSTNGTLPTGTGIIIVTVTMTKTEGGDNDGMADDISLILQQK